VEGAAILGWNWSQMGWIFWLDMESNGLEYLDGAGVKWAGIFEWNLSG
jgi:hypothetical protein